MLASDPGIQIVGIARDGDEALEQVRKLKPDVITLDIEMPRRDGLSTLQVIMAEMPMPVIMVSSLTVEGAEATLKALELGAMDFIPKYQGSSVAHLDVVELSNDLCTKVKAVVSRARRFPLRSRPLGGPLASAPLPASRTGLTAGTRYVPVQTPPRPGVAPAPRLRTGRPRRDLVAIGVSTGGPPAVQKVLSSLPEDFPACIFIAQHMPGTFTGPFAKRLDTVSRLTVKEAENGDKIQNGMVYVCPGGKHLRIDMRGAMPHLSVVTEPATALYKPSANVLMESLGLCMGSRSVGVIMTGMGNDGLEGMKVFKSKGGIAIAQNEQSCVVYGMPKAIVEAGLADDIVDLDNLPEAIIAALYK